MKLFLITMNKLFFNNDIKFYTNANLQSTTDCPKSMKIKTLSPTIYRSLKNNNHIVAVGSWLCQLCPNHISQTDKYVECNE